MRRVGSSEERPRSSAWNSQIIPIPQLGGKERNRHESDTLKAARGTMSNTAILGFKERKTNTIAVTLMNCVTRDSAERPIRGTVSEDATIHTGRHNGRHADTINQINLVTQLMVGRRLRYADLVK